MSGGLALLMVLSIEGAAQAFTDDLGLIAEHAKSVSNENKYYKRSGNDQDVLTTNQQNAVAKYNPVTLVLKGSMYVYQNVISPQLARSCPYEITCSNFSKQCIREYGIVKGVFLSADRILRCNRIGVLDVHPLDIIEKNGTISDSPNKYR
jgi:putative membrane protein insertion efficiency factor